MGKASNRHLRALGAVMAAAPLLLLSAGCPKPSQNNPGNDSAQKPPSAPTSDAGADASVVETPPPPPKAPVPGISGNIPLTVGVPTPPPATPELTRPFFDEFSWKSFIALNWPVASGARGVPEQPQNPDVFLKAAAGTPVVWASYKDTFELYGQKNQRPTPWESNTTPLPACPEAQAGKKTLFLQSKGDTPIDEVNQAFSYPLIDQHKNYAFYEVRYNRAYYDFVRGQDSDPSSWLYLLKNLVAKQKPAVQMPASSPDGTTGAIMLKAAWRIKTDKDDTSRFYTTDALVLDPATKKCTPRTVMLVGLHVAQKLKDSPEWVWSTFEQVDNVPGDTAQPPPKGYSFNNGTSNPATTGGYANRPPKKAPTVQPVEQRVPVQVTRLNPIPETPAGSSTRDINARYQQLLNGTVWQYYQLVITQWPARPERFKTIDEGGIYPQDSGDAFPANGAINTTMETYFQSQNDAAGAGGNSCMSCHYRAGKSDYSWGLMRRAH
jgi:hypothetical protein